MCSYKSRTRPALAAKSGSRGKIQLRCCQGRRASAFSQRHRVVPLISASKPCATTSCWRSGAGESREWESQTMRKLTSEGLYLHDDAGGKKERAARPEGVPPGRADAPRQIVCAIC